ncbi:hypothetical protein [Maridesulfovibrio sp.]|uniref:hypothetical protein n=1 Tax=Maridesulfovibrio sp. TaxID=2795000 RepID=UPI002AA7B9A1|nr:hypothetical protein [Maridesulfovibrio sp.]
MKKLIGIFTVLLVLCASSAFALTAEFPAYYNGSMGNAVYGNNFNGTQMFYTGFGVNATGLRTAASAKSWGRMVMFKSETSPTYYKKDLFHVNASWDVPSRKAFFNGTVVFANGSTTFTGSLGNATIATNAKGPFLTFDVTAGATAGQKIGGLATLAPVNSTLNATTYFVPVSGYQMMVGITNATNNMTAHSATALQNASTTGSGLSMSMVYQNGTFLNTSGDLAIADGATWDYYAYGVAQNDPVVIFGQVKINSDYSTTSTTGNAQARYYILNSTDNVDESTWAYFNATTYKNAAGGNLQIARKAGKTAASKTASTFYLFQNATINADQNMVSGFVTAANQKCFAVMIKSGSNLSNDYLRNKGFTTVFTGSGKANQEAGNATAGLMQFRVDNNMELTGASHNWFVKAPAAAGANFQNIDSCKANIDGYTINVASTSQFKIAQTNATFYDTAGDKVGYFYGKRSADDTFAVGIFESHMTGTTVANAQTRQSTVAYRTLAFLIPTSATTSVITNAGSAYQINASLADFTGAVGTLRTNSTGYTKAALRAEWTGIPSDFVPLTDVKGYQLTSQGKMGPGQEFYYTASFQMTGVAGRVSGLNLYKLMTDGATSHRLAYSETPSTTTDGIWWISSADGNTNLGSNSELSADQTYYVNWVVKNNGSYDTNNTENKGSTVPVQISDPVILGLGGTSSSSSSGCVFNPAAGFGLEWLLLMLAPMVAIVRSRFK